jgi:hypothetical protein
MLGVSGAAPKRRMRGWSGACVTTKIGSLADGTDGIGNGSLLTVDIDGNSRSGKAKTQRRIRKEGEITGSEISEAWITDRDIGTRKEGTVAVCISEMVALEPGIINK